VVGARSEDDREAIIVESVDGVASICLNRPDKRNALNDALFDALVAVTESMIADRQIRAVVLLGAGPAFCAGLDLSLFRSFADESQAGERPFGDPNEPGSGRRVPGRGQRIVNALRRIPVPVIAAVHGAAIGGGLQLALGADIRIAGPAAQFAAREIEYGITLDMGGTQLLPRAIGPDRALELIVSGRIVDMDEALRIGLATVGAPDPVAAAFSMASVIAGRSPDAIALSKQLVRMADASPVEDGMAAELDVMAANIGSRNQNEAVRALFERRAPQFVDRSEAVAG
jgi:enoyl-CoA hydratase/carnithine racemase